MRTQEAAIKYVKQYLMEVRNLNLSLDKAFLFGSYANGLQKKNSDIDLAIVSRDFTDNRLENWKKIAPANIKFHLVEPHLFTWSDYKDENSFLAEEILKSGIEIKLK